MSVISILNYCKITVNTIFFFHFFKNPLKHHLNHFSQTEKEAQELRVDEESSVTSHILKILLFLK